MAGDYMFDKMRDRWSATGTGTNAGVTVTKSAPTSATRRYLVTGIECSGDAACVVTVESPASTVLYQKRFAAAFTLSETFAPGTIVGAMGAAVLVKVSASTSNSEANIQGATI